MSVERSSVDTNIFFYALDPTDALKQARANLLLELVLRNSGIFCLQTLGELCNAIIRKRKELFPVATQYVTAAKVAFPIVASTVDDLSRALHAHDAHGLPFWDAMLWATVDRNSCSTLFSEDLQDGQRLGSVTFRNPFVMSERALKQFFM